MSRHHRNRTREERPQNTRRKIENLRDGLTIARRERQYDERRQFDLPPSRMEWSYDFTQDYPQTYSRIDGRPADVVQRPVNRNNMYVQESSLLSEVHDYFQDNPRYVSECVRRHRRRRVLFALHRTKKGSGVGKKHRWTELSKVRCV